MAGGKRWEKFLWPRKSGPFWQRAALLPLECLSHVYGAAVQARTRAYLEGGRQRHKVSARVIVVGNLTVGGTGKTSLAAWVSEKLVDAGYKPGIILRGYKGGGKAGPLLVSEGSGPRPDVSEAGDEAYLLARKLRCPVIVGSDRARAADTAEEELGCSHLVLDDGYQHLALARDLDILVLDSRHDPEDSFLLPRGPLREPVTAAGRAGVLVFSRSEDGSIPQWGWLESICPETPRFAMRYQTVGVFDAHSSEALPADEPYLAFSGIGTPASFAGALRKAGVKVVEQAEFPDHYCYSKADLEKLAELARKKGAKRLVTTEKDAVKIDPAWLSGTSLAVLRVEVDFMGRENEFMKTITTSSGGLE